MKQGKREFYRGKLIEKEIPLPCFSRTINEFAGQNETCIFHIPMNS